MCTCCHRQDKGGTGAEDGGQAHRDRRTSNIAEDWKMKHAEPFDREDLFSICTCCHWQDEEVPRGAMQGGGRPAHETDR